MPPEGVKLLGRWTKVDFSGGFDLLETEDPKKLVEFAYMWGDLMELNVFPVLEDQELSEALQKAMMQTRSASRGGLENRFVPLVGNSLIAARSCTHRDLSRTLSTSPSCVADAKH